VATQPDTAAPPSPEVTQALEVPGGVLPGRSASFQVHLENYEGPFDLLLGLISKHKLDVTEIAISKVTDEFVAHIRALGDTWELGEVSEFLLVAATLLDLKASRLLPTTELEDDEDLALLEARDLLFARLLQYRAFKEVASTFAARVAAEAKRRPRAVEMEPQFSKLLPEIVIGLTPHQFAELAAKAMIPRRPPVVRLDHLHTPTVSVREQAALIIDRMRKVQSASFRSLVADAEETVVVVARFLALLELFREGSVSFDQVVPLGELTVRWTGPEEGGDIEGIDEFEGAAQAPAPAGDEITPADGGE
jgi:segregation and condensation protein A